MIYTLNSNLSNYPHKNTEPPLTGAFCIGRGGFALYISVIDFSYINFQRMQLICKKVAECRKSIRFY